MSNIKHVTNARGVKEAQAANKADVPRVGWDKWMDQNREKMHEEMKILAQPNTIQSVTDRIKVLMEKVSPGNFYFDESILNWVDHKTVNLEDSQLTDQNLELWPLPKGGMKESDMINRLSEEGRFIELNYLQGLLEVERLLKEGVLNKKGTHISIFVDTLLKSEKDCIFFLYRCFGGELRLSVNNRHAGRHWSLHWSTLSQDSQNSGSE